MVKGGSASAWGCLFDGKQLLAFTRSSATSSTSFVDESFTLDGRKDAGSWVAIISSYEIPGMELPTGLTTATVSQDQNIKVYGGKNQIFVEAQENSEVQILNIYGQIVKSMTVTAGKQVVSVPKGIYIVNNNKVLVY